MQTARRASLGHRIALDLQRHKWKYILMIPILIYLILFCYKPMYGLIIAFKNYKPALGFAGSKWVGLKYFKKFFGDYYFFRILRNTFLISLYSILWGFPAPILLALMLNELRGERFKRTVQTVTYIPHFISMVVICSIIRQFCLSDGVFNDIGAFFGAQRTALLQKPAYFRTIYVASGIWQEIGWSSIIYLAALTNVDPQLMEAAVVDGANRFQRVWNVSLPALMPTISIQLIFSISGIMSASTEKTLLLYNEATYEVGDVIGTYVYREGILGGAFEYTTAIGLLMSIVSLVLITLANYGSRLFSENSLW